MLFALCGPGIESSIRKYLVLNVLCGFSCSSLARILERNEKALEEQLASEKKKITEAAVRLTRTDMEENLGVVTKNIYEIFSLGQKRSPQGSIPNRILVPFRNKTCEMLLDFPATKNPEFTPLVSFMLLNASRLHTMNDGTGKPLGIKEQNRELWDRNMIKRGFKHLALSAEEGGRGHGNSLKGRR